MGMLWQNIRYAARASMRSPGYAAVTVLSLALGIGANTAIFSILDAILFRELPVPRPQELVQLSPIYRNGGRVPFSYPMFQELARSQKAFSGVYGWTGAAEDNVEAGGALFVGRVRAVTANYFSGLGATPLLGRLIGPGDGVTAAAFPAVLSYEAWQSRFGSDPAIAGKTLRIDGRPFTIVGVTRQWFPGVMPGEPPDFTIPIEAAPIQGDLRAMLWISVTGRLRSGVTIDQARAQIAGFWPDLLRNTVPLAARGQRRQSFLAMRLAVEPAATGVNRGLRTRYSRPLYLIMGIVALILLIACVNLASLALARAAARGKEVNIRVALGAGRGQIAWQLLTESLLLSIAGALLALVFANWGGPLLAGLITRGYSEPLSLDLRPDWRVFCFAAVAALLTGSLIGLIPAWRMSRENPALVLRQGSAARGTGRSGQLLIVTQIALSLVLMFGAGLLLRTFDNLRSSFAGFQRTGILEAELRARPGADQAGAKTYWRQLIEHSAALPGAWSAAFSALPVPAGGLGWKDTVASVDANSTQPNVLATLVYVSPGFFQTLAIPVLSGRDFDWNDDTQRSPVAIIDSQTARRLFPAGSAVGKHIRFGVQPEFQSLEIAGVARDARLIDLRDAGHCVLFIPMAQHPDFVGDGRLFVRATRAASLMRPIEQEVGALGRDYVSDTKTIEQMTSETLVVERATAILSTAFAAAALLLAGIGLFGLMSYTVTRRTREIGIRMALGSQPGAILRMVLRETLLLTLAGIAMGVPCALAVSRLIAHALFGLPSTDPLTLAAACAALVAIGAIAGYLPARRVACGTDDRFLSSVLKC